MSYPKPLSEKGISRQYIATGLTGEQIGFLRRFFAACTNLYGVFMAEEAWDVYKELSSKTVTVPLHRKDMYAALSVLRREPVPYYVFEADEIYSEEPRSDRYRVIALRDIVSPGYGKYNALYHIMEASEGKPFYVPKNLLEYAEMKKSRYESRLLEILGKLKSTQSEYEDKWGHTHPCKYCGQYLRDFAFVSRDDEYELCYLRGEVEGVKGNAKRALKFEAQINSISAAQYLVEKLKWRSNIGFFTPSEAIGCFFDALNEMGVSLAGDKQVNELLQAINDLNNHQNLWCNHGWSPLELSMQFSRHGTPTISFGAGLQEAFAKGTMDEQELIRKLKELGMEVLE